MNTKLTLTIEDRVIAKAKKYAKTRGRSLSSIVETYLEALTLEDDPTKNKPTPIVDSLRGSFKIPEGKDYKELLTEALMEKYMGR